MDFLPTLYKKTKTGAVQTWTIGVNHSGSKPVIVTQFGQLGGAIQIAEDVILEGKNIGRANATTPAEQAEKESNASHENKLAREGYTLDPSGIKETTIPVPMLAHKYSDHGHKLKLPLFSQPKMDGSRMMSVRSLDGKVLLYSRKGTIYSQLPHINKALEVLGVDFVLDGELYQHKYKDDLPYLTHLIKGKNSCPAEGYEEVEFHIFDVQMPGTFEERFNYLKSLNLQHPLVLVKTCAILNDSLEDGVEMAYDKFADQGYEGVILRTSGSHYIHSRSYDCQKYKQFEDAEFEIVGVEEGRGKRAGHLGRFICKTKSGVEFGCDYNATQAQIKEVWDNRDSYIGKEATVRFQGYFKDTGKPRFAKMLAIRDYE